VQNKVWRPWIPVGIWLAVLALESSDFGSSAHTGSLLLGLWSALFGRPNPDTFELVHHIIRKTGHFTGYGILSWLIFRALRASWRNRQQILARGREYFWQLRWAVLGVAGTALVASLDEIHQTFNSARTGRWQDVVIDSCGAISVQFLLYLALLWRRNKVEPQIAVP
jgi:VanZ family protein